MQFLWRTYAVVYLVWVIVGLPPMLRQLTHMSPISMIDLFFFTPVAIFALWSAAYRHINLPWQSWKALLFISVFWRPIAIGNAVLFGDTIPKFSANVNALAVKAGTDPSVMMLAAAAAVCLLGSLAILPPLVALYRNAYGDESLLRLMAPGKVSPQPSSQGAA